MRLFSSELLLFFKKKIAQNAFWECYDGILGQIQPGCPIALHSNRLSSYCSRSHEPTRQYWHRRHLNAHRPVVIKRYTAAYPFSAALTIQFALKVSHQISSKYKKVLSLYFSLLFAAGTLQDYARGEKETGQTLFAPSSPWQRCYRQIWVTNSVPWPLTHLQFCALGSFVNAWPRRNFICCSTKYHQYKIGSWFKTSVDWLCKSQLGFSE